MKCGGLHEYGLVNAFITYARIWITIRNNLKICNEEPSSILHLHDRKSINLAVVIVSRKKGKDNVF